MPINIVDKTECTGCASCAQACPKQAITMTQDCGGFLYPIIDKEHCVDCGLCQKVCPIRQQTQKDDHVLSTYAGYANDDEIRIESSSGGIFSVLAQYVLSNHGLVFGAAMDKQQKVYHLGIDKAENLKFLQGSKYVQSDVRYTYTETRAALKEGRPVLYTGTPCQISGLKQYLRNDYEQLLTVDVLCHGVPSPKLWDRYVEQHTMSHGSPVQQSFFRNKHLGWKSPAVVLKFQDSTAYFKKISEDPFMTLFLNNVSLRDSCYACRFKKLNRDSDLTIGDAWGIENVMPELDDNKGTSVILVHSEKGQKVLNEISQSLTIMECDVDRLLSPEADSRRSVKEHPNRAKLFNWLNQGKTIDELASLAYLPRRFKSKVKHKLLGILRKIKNTK